MRDMNGFEKIIMNPFHIKENEKSKKSGKPHFRNLKVKKSSSQDNSLDLNERVSPEHSPLQERSVK